MAVADAPVVIRYQLGELLNFIGEDHFYRQKTKKVYRNYYLNAAGSGSCHGNAHAAGSSVAGPAFPVQSQSQALGHSSTNAGSLFHKRKSYLTETEVFSDERSIQEIRGVLGKMSASNKQLIIDTLRKNQVSEASHDVLIQLLHQYATLCIEWNDLYLSIYDKVYYQNDPVFYEKLFHTCARLVDEPRHYDDPEQKTFFRVSNIELYCKLGMTYANFRKDSLQKWCLKTLAHIYDLYHSSQFQTDWISLYIHFASTFLRGVSLSEKKAFRRKVKAEQSFLDIQSHVDGDKFPIKIKFKWLDFTDLLSAD